MNKESLCNHAKVRQKNHEMTMIFLGFGIKQNTMQAKPLGLTFSLTFMLDIGQGKEFHDFDFSLLLNFFNEIMNKWTHLL